MTNRRITFILVSVVTLGIVLGMAVSTGLAWMAPKIAPDLSDPRALISGIGSRTEARYQQDVEHCRGLVLRTPEQITMPDCMRRNGYVVAARR